jgi:hypothetical protein
MEHQRNREGEAMAATSTTPTTSKPEVRATYECDEGTRQLVGQRINGRVALSDVPVSDVGKVYLLERHGTSMAELEAIEADYLALAATLRRPPLRSEWILG